MLAKLHNGAPIHFAHLDARTASVQFPVPNPEHHPQHSPTSTHAESPAGLEEKDQHLEDALASLLRQYGRAYDLCNGRQVHDYMIRHGYYTTTFLGNCLVEMYGNCACVDEAQFVFDHIPEPNLYSWNFLLKAFGQNGNVEGAHRVFLRIPHKDNVSWNAMFASYAQNKQEMQAINLFRQMQHDDAKPDCVTFICVLNVFSDHASYKCGQEVHASIIVHGLEHNPVVGTTLVSMYGKCGLLSSSICVFDRIRKRDAVCWNAMLAAYTHSDEYEKALELFHQMQVEGIKLGKVSFMCVLDACSGLMLLYEGRRIHATISSLVIQQDISVGNALVNLYGKCGSLNEARATWQSMPIQDIITWNTIMTSLRQYGQGEEALDLFYRMQMEDFKPNGVSLLCALNACADLKALTHGQEIHHKIIHSMLECELMTGNALVNMYAKCEKQCCAGWVLMKMPKRDVVSWNAIISAFSQHGYGQEAMELFQLMQLDGILPDNVTFVSAVDACRSLGCLRKGKEVHAIIVHLQYQQDVIVGTALINMYGRCGNLAEARIVFGRLECRNVVTWNTLIAVLVLHNQGEDALSLFYEMQLDGALPDKVSFASIIDACASLPVLQKGKEIHDIICDYGYEQDAVVGTSLINMYGKCGTLLRARNIFDKLQHWDLISCNAMISAFTQCGNGEEALDLYVEMQQHGIRPNSVTFISVLTACSYGGQVQEGMHYFFSMKEDYGISYIEDHYGCMVDILGRAGHLAKAESFIDSTPYKNSVLLWSTLLGACRLHGDMERGQHAAKLCSELDPEIVTPFVLLLSIYSAAASTSLMGDATS